MAFDCTSCGRTSTADGAMFCMFCGERLSDPHATIDHLPVAFDASNSGQDTVPDGPMPMRVGGYRIVRHLGEGGMGSVYEATDDESGKRVAVKLLSNKLASNPTSVERFRQEGRLASQLSHPRCVFVYDADADAGRPFIVMELMPGQTLKDVVEKKGRFSPTEAVLRILDVVDGLIEAHRFGLIHRDVKPSNCFLTADDRVKVGDFGLSKSLVESESDVQLTGTGAFLGTVLYAAPEQIRGEEVGYDSDVYSVCATLYYLLTARAPYQHESLTAALARAISEPSPSIRRLRPDVPKALDRVVRKGLERDRKRRFGSLEELRDALQQLLPDEQIPGRTRMMAAAYSIDFLVMIFLVRLPVEFFEWLFGMPRGFFGADLFIDPIASLGFILYFGACEGLLGLTFGKWLLGLRVVPLGSVGPPGFGLATLRSGIFHAGWLLILGGFNVIAELPTFGTPLGVLMIVAGIAGLCYRRRQPMSNRGLHDLATGCHVVQMPRRPHRVRLVSQAANRLERATQVKELPADLGGYTVRGRISSLTSGAQVWLADDRSLGRRVLIHLLPADAPEPPPRSSRLRLLGTGELTWNDRDWTWHAFAAPTGAPLADMIPAGKPLNWPDSRLILEQIVEELIQSEIDRTRPERTGVNHFWCEPGGRIFLLDFPMPSVVKSASTDDPMTLVRQATTLLLEGTPRADGGGIKAPLPPRASAIVNHLFDEKNPCSSLQELQCSLGESHAHEPTVTTKLRATHLGVAAVLLAVPLFVMYASTQFIGFFAATQSLNLRAAASALANRIEQPQARAELMTDDTFRKALEKSPVPDTIAGLRTFANSQYSDFEQELQKLAKPERYLAVKYRDQLTANEKLVKIAPRDAANFVTGVQSEEFGTNIDEWREIVLLIGSQTCGFFLIMFILFAFVFRGGVAYWVAGIALVQRDGRRASRWKCALRELVLWLPLIVVLLLTGLVQVLWPGWFSGRIVASGIAVAVLVGYVALGLRHPEQGPLDRLFGTCRVPL